VRFLAVVCVVILLVLSTTSSLAFATSQHGCAPVTPPPVAGPLTQPPAGSGILFINEVLLVPHSTWNCSESGTYTPTSDAWAEIYNSQDQPFDLYAVHASIDSGPNTNPFYLPFGSAIAPHSFLVVFPRTDSRFLSTENSTWRLLLSGVPVDEITIPSLSEDQSYARVPDGSSAWQISSSPTIDASNTVVQPTPTLSKRDATATARSARGTGSRSSDKGSGGNTGRGRSGGNNGTGGSGWDSGGSRQKQADGVQPAWTALQFPNTTPATSAVSTSGGILSSSPQVVDGIDTPHKILLTILVVALALALLWCWRLFRIS